MKILRTLSLSLLFAGTALTQTSTKVVYLPARQMNAQLHKLPLNEIGESEIDLIEHTRDHSAILLRRTAPGKAEVHETENDVWYVIDGGAEFVTGGSVVDGRQTEPGQIRGKSISGGEEHQLAKGDFIRVPAGVPHWVKSIHGKELVYIVVKYTSSR